MLLTVDGKLVMGLAASEMIAGIRPVDASVFFPV
jgi:hypothetical protein